MSSVRPKTEHFLAGQTQEIPRRKQKKKRNRWDPLSILYRMLVPIVSMQTFPILLFLWLRETVKFCASAK